MEIKLNNQTVNLKETKNSYDEHSYLEGHIEGIDLAIHSLALSNLGLDKVVELISYVFNNFDVLKRHFAEAEVRGKSRLDWFNESIPDEPFLEVLSKEEFLENLILKTITIAEREENNFTGNVNKNHFLLVGMNNNGMFGSGWSEIQLSKDYDNVCYL